MSVGENIKKIREEKGMTQKELAEKCGIIYQTIGKYERGLLNPKMETLVKIANAMDVYASDLLKGVNNDLSLDEFDIIFEADEEKLNVEEEKLLKKNGLYFINSCISKLYDRDKKYLNTPLKSLGVAISLGTFNVECTILTNEELKKIENKILDYTDYLLYEALKDKEKTNYRVLGEELKD